MVRKTTCACGKPLELHRIGKQRNCLACKAESMRRTRKKYRELSAEDKLKSNCRAYLNVYVKRGIVKKQPCLICNNPKSQAHHEDYSKPLEVTWYCRMHHTHLHRLAKIAA